MSIARLGLATAIVVASALGNRSGHRTDTFGPARCPAKFCHRSSQFGFRHAACRGRNLRLCDVLQCGLVADRHGGLGRHGRSRPSFPGVECRLPTGSRHVSRRPCGRHCRVPDRPCLQSSLRSDCVCRAVTMMPGLQMYRALSGFCNSPSQTSKRSKPQLPRHSGMRRKLPGDWRPGVGTDCCGSHHVVAGKTKELNHGQENWRSDGRRRLPRFECRDSLGGQGGARRGWETIGIIGGYDGLLPPGNVRNLDYHALDGLLVRGGTILGTANRGQFTAKVGHGEGRNLPTELLDNVKRGWKNLGSRHSSRSAAMDL